MTDESQLPVHTRDPYEAGRREWMERYGDLVQARDQWKVAFFATMLVALLAVGGMVAAALQNHMIPYVVRVDRLGMPLAVGRATEAQASDPAVVRAQLARWIANTRTVYADAAAQRTVIDEAYALVERNSPAYLQLNEHFATSNPFERAESETVTVEVHTALPLGDASWRIEWTETARARNGQVIGTPQEWQAAVTAKSVTPGDEATLLRNPLGTYVREFSWTKRL